jgi:hypothetical protein
MAIPTDAEQKTLDYAINGQPLCEVPAKDGVLTNLGTMDTALYGQPYVTNFGTGGSSGTSSDILKIVGVPQVSILKVCGVANASMNKVAGVANIV